jgi:eukaryotic-like serine/threonine-protein kinase
VAGGMSQQAPSPGNLVAGRYRLEQLLVQGGMGNVWRAHHISLNAPVAIKFISPLIAEDEEALGRFMLEAQSAAALRSSHIVQVFDFGIDDGTPFITMELLHGESLAERLRRLGTLTAVDTGRILSQVARGIHYAHTTGIVHRDLKPDNIFLSTEGDHEVAKVLDFGIAKATTKELRGQTPAETRAGALLGSPFYVSPEQAEGNRDIDHRSDLWALGIIVFECLTGKRPFEGASLGSLLVKICTHPSPRPSDVGKVPTGFDAWFLRATEKDRTRRFQSARELVDGYASLLTLGSAHLSEIAWTSSTDGLPAETRSQADENDAHATTAMSPTPHQASINDSALAVTPTLVQRGRSRRIWQSLLGAVLLVGLVGGVFRTIKRDTLVSSRSKSARLVVDAATSVPEQPKAAPSTAAQADRLPGEMPPASQPAASPEVTLVAPSVEASKAQRAVTAQSSIRPNGASQLVSGANAKVEIGLAQPTKNPSPAPTATSAKELFRDRKLTGEIEKPH